MHNVIDSGEYGDIHVVSGEYLWGLVNKQMSFFEVLDKVLLQDVKVDIGCPGVSVEDGKEN